MFMILSYMKMWSIYKNVKCFWLEIVRSKWCREVWTKMAWIWETGSTFLREKLLLFWSLMESLRPLWLVFSCFYFFCIKKFIIWWARDPFEVTHRNFSCVSEVPLYLVQSCMCSNEFLIPWMHSRSSSMEACIVDT